MTWPIPLPATQRFVLADAAVPRCTLTAPLGELKIDREDLIRVDLGIAGGTIVSIAAHDHTHDRTHDAAHADAKAAAHADAPPRIDLAGRQIWPCFVDMHTHLDKGHIWPRAENPDGTFAGALAATTADRGQHWNAADVEPRFEFGLRAAYAHGTSAIRTHLDSLAPQHTITWPVFARLRERWRGRIDLQAVTILQLVHLQEGFGDELADLVAAHGGVLGAVVHDAQSAATLNAQLDRIFALARDRGLDLDFHADETGDADAAALRAIAEAKIRNRFNGTVVVGHCCSLAVQPPDEVARTLDAVAKAELAIVSLPLCNLFLQDRSSGRTPRWRGVTLLHELRERGIRVAVASDNCRDPFFGYGDHDMLEVFTQAARIAHLDRPVGAWPAAVNAIPAQVMGLQPAAHRGVLAVGAPADLVLFNARSYSELLSRPQSDRVVLRNGSAIDTALPDYRELDVLMQSA